MGVDDLKQINQIANFAAVEWPANIKIGKKPPADYVPPLDHAMNAEERDRLYGWHALPPLWWEMPYHEFLVERRVRMADVIRQAWERSEEHTSELQSLMRISYAVFCLKKKNNKQKKRNE